MVSELRRGILYVWIRASKVSEGKLFVPRLKLVGLAHNCITTCTIQDFSCIAVVRPPLVIQCTSHTHVQARTFAVELGPLVSDVEYLAVHCHVQFSRRSSAVKLFQLSYAQFLAFLWHTSLLLLLLLLPGNSQDALSDARVSLYFIRRMHVLCLKTEAPTT